MLQEGKHDLAGHLLILRQGIHSEGSSTRKIYAVRSVNYVISCFEWNSITQGVCFHRNILSWLNFDVPCHYATSKCVYIQVSRADAQLRTTERRKTLRITVSVDRFQDPLCPCLDLGSQDLHLHWLPEKELMVTKDCALRQGTFTIRLGLNAFTHTHSV